MVEYWDREGGAHAPRCGCKSCDSRTTEELRYQASLLRAHPCPLIEEDPPELGPALPRPLYADSKAGLRRVAAGAGALADLARRRLAEADVAEGIGGYWALSLQTRIDLGLTPRAEGPRWRWVDRDGNEVAQ